MAEATQGQDSGKIDIAALVAQSQQSKATTDAILIDTAEGLSAMRGAGSRESSAIMEQATAAAEVLAIDERQKLAKTAKSQRSAAIIGTDPDATTSILQSMMGTIHGISGELDVRDAAIQKKLDTGFMDDPLGWIVNQFSLPGDVVAYNNRLQKLNEKEELLGRLQEKTKNQIQINENISANTSEEKIAAMNVANMAIAKAKVAQSEQALAKAGLDTMSIRMAANGQQWQMAVGLNNAMNQEQHLVLARSANTIAQRNLELNTELKNLQIQASENVQEAKAALQSKLDKATGVLGMNRITVAEFQMLSGPVKNILESAAADPNIEQGMIGRNMADSIAKANSVNAPLTPGINGVRRILTNIKGGVLKDNENTWKSFTPEVQEQKVQEKYEVRIKQEIANIPDAEGIYSAPSLVKVLEIPMVASTTIGKTLAPLAKILDYPTKSAELFTTGLNLITTGKLTPDQAADELSGIYTSIVVDNNQQRAYQRLSVPRQKSFNASIQTSAGWGGSTTLDLSNREAVKNAYIRATAAVKVNEMMQNWPIAP